MAICAKCGKRSKMLHLASSVDNPEMVPMCDECYNNPRVRVVRYSKELGRLVGMCNCGWPIYEEDKKQSDYCKKCNAKISDGLSILPKNKTEWCKAFTATAVMAYERNIPSAIETVILYPNSELVLTAQTFLATKKDCSQIEQELLTLLRSYKDEW